ncbi:cell cycle control protein cwf14 [Lindgomyces ingoldianus]|uniref:Cell cycle control protein cwf14 n=1 Tax=Lindgomyces ingoldianus TaxID=673940 RepID=A0ACB6R4G0_9PLEO|nr:cell cycle control protein cwf14 [Lindgomyces ingoldianus]KAF2474041.1 cell cycle control protein cwf14 [Lindgomyces ingoldianus]
MPPIRHPARHRKPPPEGFEDIEDTLLEFHNKMKDAENASHEGKKKYEMLWPIFQITHQRSRYIYDLYYEKEAISKQLYDWLLKNGYADPMLIAKWKKQGYEKLCCLRCIQTKETNFKSTCICRVPQANLKDGRDIQCVSCGCNGCSSGD